MLCMDLNSLWAHSSKTPARATNGSAWHGDGIVTFQCVTIKGCSLHGSDSTGTLTLTQQPGRRSFIEWQNYQQAEEDEGAYLTVHNTRDLDGASSSRHDVMLEDWCGDEVTMQTTHKGQCCILHYNKTFCYTFCIEIVFAYCKCSSRGL